MRAKKITYEEALKFIDAQPKKYDRPEKGDIQIALNWLNELLESESLNGVGSIADQQALFEELVRRSRRKKGGGFDILSKMLISKWSTKSKNVFAISYSIGHEDGNINGSHFSKQREANKQTKVTKKRVNEASNTNRNRGLDTRNKIITAAAKFRHLSRDDASHHIAAEVHKSAGRVRQLLSEIFPGNEWKKTSL